MKIRLFLLLPALLLSACDRSEGRGCEDLIVSDAWIREMPPGPSMTAGYLQIENHGPGTASLQGFNSEAFGRIEMHETREVDGQMQMRQIEAVEIASGDILQMAPGGRHLMLFDPVQPLKAGEQRSLTLHCASSKLPLVAEVRKGSKAAMAHDDHGMPAQQD